MILKQEENMIIRTIEVQDKNEILEMFRKENFGFFGPLADQKPSVYDEMRAIDNVLAKEELAEQYLILEIEGIIVTYMCVYQDRRDSIHIGSMITKEEYRNQGYGAYLLRFIIEYANQNNLTIRTETLTCESLLRRMKFQLNTNGRKTDYIYFPKKSTFSDHYYKFLDYAGSIKKEQKRQQEEIKSYEKTLEFLKNIGFL